MGEFNQLFLLDLTTRRQQQLTVSPCKSTRRYGRLTAAGSILANADGTVQVWRIPASAGSDSREQPLTTGVERMIHFFYSPDGRWLFVQPIIQTFTDTRDGGTPCGDSLPENKLFLEKPNVFPGRPMACLQPWQRRRSLGC